MRLSWLLTLLILSTALSQTFQPVSLRVLSGVSVNGDLFSSAIFQFETDQDLSVAFSGGMCDTSYVCPPPCYCDYYNDWEIFWAVDYDPSTHPCNCPAIVSTASAPRKFSWCNNDTSLGPLGARFHSEVLEDGDSITYRIEDASKQSHIISTFSTTCDPFLFTLSSQSQDPASLYFMNISFLGNPLITTETTSGYLICPDSQLWGRVLVMGVTTGGGTTYGNMSVSFQKLTMPPVRDPACVVPSEYPDHYCIPTGVRTNINVASASVVRFLVRPNNRCGILMFDSSTNLLKISTEDPWISPSNSSYAAQKRAISGTKEPGVWHYCLEGTQEYIFGWIYVQSQESIFIDTDKDWIHYRELSDFRPWDYVTYLAGGVTIECGDNHSFTQYTRESSQVSSIDDGHANVRFLWPTEDPSPFYAPPLSARSWKWKSSVHVDNVPEAIPRRLAVSMLLDQRILPLPSLTPNSINYQFLSESELPTCSLKINGILVDRNRNPVPQTMNASEFPEADTSCDPDLFLESSEEVSFLLDELLNVPASEIVLLSQISFKIEIILSSRNWLNCQNSVKSSVVEGTTTLQDSFTRCVAPFGSNEWNNDPCCVNPIGSIGYGQCAAVARTFTQTKPTGYHSNISRCPVSKCAEKSLENLYAEENLQKNPVTSCYTSSKFIYDKQRLTPIFQCLYQHYGYQPAYQGLPCEHDNDCTLPGSICLLKSKTCLPNLELTLSNFLTCLVDKLAVVDSYILTEVSNAINVTATSNLTLLASEWRIRFPADPVQNVCNDPLGHFITFEPAYTWISNPTPACAQSYCPYLSISRTTPSSLDSPLPWDCVNPTTPTCVMLAYDQPGTFCSRTRCVSTLGEFSTPVCPNRTYCAVCEGLPECKEMTSYGITDTATCGGQFACVLANNTVIFTVDQAACSATKSCSVQGAYYDEASCNSTGKCADSSHLITGLFVRNWAATAGACFFDQSYIYPFNTTQPLLCSYPSRTTAIGCMITIPQQNCSLTGYNWGNTQIFNTTNIRWIEPATTEDECNSYGRKCSGPFKESVSSSISVDFELYPKDNECDGVIEPIFEWTQGKWRGGQLRELSVISEKGTRFLRYTEPGAGLFDFNTMFNLLAEKSDEHYGLIIQRETFCRTSKTNLALRELVCSCEAGENESSCFDDNSDSITDLGVACSNDLAEIIVPPFKFGLTSPLSLETGVCQTLRIKTEPSNLYASNVGKSFATVLVRTNEDPSYAVRNANYAIIGTVLSDGFRASFEKPMTRIRLCATLRNENVLHPTEYPILDIAYHSTSGFNLIPLGVNVTRRQILNNGSFELCGIIPQLQANYSFFFVERLNEWKDVQRQIFDSGTVIYMSVLLSLYAIGWAISFIKIVYSLLFRGITLDRLFFILLVVCILFTFRVVLFSLLLSNSLENSSRGAVDYLLIEFPFILYFFIVTNYIILWAMIVRVSKDITFREGSFIPTLNIATIIANAVILGVFLLLIILYETVVLEPVLACGGTVYIFDSDASFALIISYRSLFSFFGLVLGLCLIYLGIRLAHVISKVISTSPANYLRIYLVAIVCGGGLIIQAIYLLIVTALQDIYSNYLALSFLLVMEVLPMLTFVFSTEIEPVQGRGISSFATSKASSGETPTKSAT